MHYKLRAGPAAGNFVCAVVCCVGCIAAATFTDAMVTVLMVVVWPATVTTDADGKLAGTGADAATAAEDTAGKPIACADDDAEALSTTDDVAEPNR